MNFHSHAAGGSHKMLTGLTKTGGIIAKSRQREGSAPLPNWVQRRRDMSVWFWPIYSGKCICRSQFFLQLDCNSLSF